MHFQYELANCSNEMSPAQSLPTDSNHCKLRSYWNDLPREKGHTLYRHPVNKS